MPTPCPYNENLGVKKKLNYIIFYKKELIMIYQSIFVNLKIVITFEMSELKNLTLIIPAKYEAETF